MSTFRPSGVGCIYVGAPGDMTAIEFDEIVCDVCNAECGLERVTRGDVKYPDGTVITDPIYYDGWGSYCVECGKEAEEKAGRGGR
jgi:hypothetical protein